MQCAACRAAYSSALEACPRCHTPAPAPAAEAKSTPPAAKARTETRAIAAEAVAAHASNSRANETATATAPPPPAPPASTLIEFPGTGRAARPQWRKDLSERVREIQQRRAREAALEREAALGMEDEFADSQADELPIETQDGTEVRTEDARTTPLGLVPPRTDAPELNPLVAAALRRIERARQPLPPAPKPRTKSGGAATATAIAYQEDYQAKSEPVSVAPPAPPAARATPRHARVAEAKSASEPPKSEALTIDSATETRMTAETTRPPASGLVVVPSQTPARAETSTQPAQVDLPPAARTAARTTHSPAATAQASQTAAAQMQASQTPASQTAAAPLQAGESSALLSTEATAAAAAPDTSMRATKPRRHIPVVLDETTLERREAAILDAANCVPVVETFSDRAPLVRRLVASVADLFFMAFLCAPCAAIIELTSGNWADTRVMASMGGIILLVMFLYLVVSTGLLGRTPGMWIFSLRAVDVRTALVPTTGQSTKRAFFYLLSLVTLGIGLIYALFDAEGRTVHDYLSGTIVVNE